MKPYRLTLLFFVILFSCNSKTEERSGSKPSTPDLNSFPKFNSRYSNRNTISLTDKTDNKYQLDSSQFANWTDKYTPFKTEFGRHYTAELYSLQPQFGQFATLAIRTDGDDWTKIHLVTINQDLELIDKVEAADSWADLLEQDDNVEIVGKNRKYTNMLSDSAYEIIAIGTTEFINYQTDSTRYEIDSVVTRVDIRTDGTFSLTRLDSVRTEKHSNTNL